MNHWRYKNKTITSLEQLGNPLLLFGFVYRVTGPTGKWYLGKKNFNTKRKKKLTKKSLQK